MQTDSLFYRLFQTAPGLFFELIGQPPEVSQGYIFRSVELKQTAFRIDGVFLPTPKTAPSTVYFLEVQFQKDQYLYRRLFAEICLFLRQNPDIMDWQAVVIYPDKSLEPSDLRPYQNWLAPPEIHRIYLDQLAEEPSSPGIDLIRLIIEPEPTAIDHAKQLLNQAKQTAIADLSQKAIIELIETIVVYKFPQLSRQEIEQMLHLSDLKQTKVYQEALAEGLEQGKQQAGATLITQLLAHKFGDLPPAVRSSIEQLSLTQIEALAKTLFEFSTLQDVIDCLQMHTSN